MRLGDGTEARVDQVLLARLDQGRRAPVYQLANELEAFGIRGHIRFDRDDIFPVESQTPPVVWFRRIGYML